MNQLKKQKEMVCQKVDELAEWSEQISRELFTHPELSDREYRSSAYLVKQMEAQGFTVTYPYMELDTAFRCEIGNENGRKIAFLAEYAALNIYVRDAYKERLENIIERLIDIGKGAELMTQARFQWTRAENTYYDIKQNQNLQKYMYANLKELGITKFEKGDIYHSISSDIGNVSYHCPTCYCTMGVSHFSDAGLHEEAFLEVADSQEAHKLLHIAAKAMAMSALDVFAEKEGKEYL